MEEAQETEEGYRGAMIIAIGFILSSHSLNSLAVDFCPSL